jgi:glycyl-tRNA synthetase beta chain
MSQSLNTAPLLVELFTEELPPKSLKKLSESFSKSIVEKLVAQGLASNDVVLSSFATPRRLAVHLSSVLSVAADKAVREKLLPVSIALDATGQATPPLLKKLASLGHENYPLDKLERSGEGKNEAFYLNATQAGTHLAAGLQEALDFAISKLPIAKTMNYQLSPGTDKEVDAQFVRPAHGLVALHGSSIVPVSALGLNAGNSTLGHRFLSKSPAAVNSGDLSGQRVEITSADAYEDSMTSVKVVASFEKRRELMKSALLSAALSAASSVSKTHQVLMPDSLLDEVCSLVEWPVIYTCEFEQEFLEVPQECLILTMQTNQKYFAMTDAAGKLVNQFLIVSNIETATPDSIISGNERVVRPRLADARFFFTQDRKKKLIDRVPELGKVVYHNKLGNQLERVERVRLIAKRIAGLLINRGLATPELAGLAERAALLAKADLLTDMVGEFPELQGIMGTYYAKHDGEHADVAAACTEHYQPRFAGDSLPASSTGLVLALADKLETLVGIWGIGLHPTGEKDPFALRRHALGICRLLIEKNLPLSVVELIEIAREHFNATGSTEVLENATVEKIHGFILDRLRAYLKDAGGNAANSTSSSTTYKTEEIEAVLGNNPSVIADLPKRLVAVREFLSLPEAQTLAAANKRISNILKKVEGGTSSLPTKVSAALLSVPAEKALAAGVDALAPVIRAAFEKEDFTGALKSLSAISGAVSAFFEDVMVMDPDLKLRDNRLALLNTLHIEMNRVADLAKLAQ